MEESLSLADVYSVCVSHTTTTTTRSLSVLWVNDATVGPHTTPNTEIFTLIVRVLLILLLISVCVKVKLRQATQPVLRYFFIFCQHYRCVTLSSFQNITTDPLRHHVGIFGQSGDSLSFGRLHA